jgi:hypothetical protein
MSMVAVNDLGVSIYMTAGGLSTRESIVYDNHWNGKWAMVIRCHSEHLKVWIVDKTDIVWIRGLDSSIRQFPWRK